MKPWARPRGGRGVTKKGEGDNDDLGDGAPPKLALLLVMMVALMGVLHIGKWRRHLDGG